MNSDSWLRQPLVKLSLGLLVVLVIGIQIYLRHTQPIAAQTASSSEILNLKTRVRLLETEVRRLKRSTGRSEPFQPGELLPEPTAPSPQVVDGRAIGRTDPMFQRLATLVIELKEQVAGLEERLSQVENQLEE